MARPAASVTNPNTSENADATTAGAPEPAGSVAVVTVARTATPPRATRRPAASSKTTS